MSGTSICLDCTKKTCLKTGKPCKNVERILRRLGIYSRDWIRPRVSSKKAKDGKGPWREIPFSMLSDVEIDKNKWLQDNDL